MTDQELLLRAAEARHARLATAFDSETLRIAGVTGDLAAAKDLLAQLHEDAVEGR